MASASYVFTNGTIIDAPEVNKNFGELDQQFFVTTGTAHNHNGVSSKKIIYSDIDVTGLGTSDVLMTSGTAVVGTARFSTTVGHDHDGTDSKYLSVGALNIDSSTIDTTTYTTINPVGTPVDAKVFTFTAPDANAVLVGVRADAELKNDANDGACMRLKIENNSASTTATQPIFYGTKYLAGGHSAFTAAWVTANMVDIAWSTTGGGIPLVSADTTFTITVQFARYSSTGTVSIKNIKVTVYWLKAGLITTDSGLFS